MRGCFDIVRVVVLMAHACMIRWLCQLSPRSEGAAYSMRADRVRQIVRKTYMFFFVNWMGSIPALAAGLRCRALRNLSRRCDHVRHMQGRLRVEWQYVRGSPFLMQFYLAQDKSCSAWLNLMLRGYAHIMQAGLSLCISEHV